MVTPHPGSQVATPRKTGARAVPASKLRRTEFRHEFVTELEGSIDELTRKLPRCEKPHAACVTCEREIDLCHAFDFTINLCV